MASFRDVPACEKKWDEDDEIMLLDMMAEMTRKIELSRTIIATGVIVAVRQELNYRRRQIYIENDVVCSLAFLKRKYFDFEGFIAIPGVQYNEYTNIVTVDHDHLMCIQFPTVCFSI